MSIDARVVGIIFPDAKSGPGKLVLEARDPKSGPAGQSVLNFPGSSPDWVNDLMGKEVWGGAGELVYGDQVIGRRVGYTAITWVASELHGLSPKAAAEAGKSPANPRE